MPYLAGFIDETKYDVVLIDEYNQTIPYEQKFDLVAITVNTPNASHCYKISRRFRRHGVKVVMGGPTWRFWQTKLNNIATILLSVRLRRLGRNSLKLSIMEMRTRSIRANTLRLYEDSPLHEEI